MSKKTAVEWLHEIAKQREPDKFDWQQAKKMEKEQIEDAWYDGISGGQCGTSEQYYNETYGQTKAK